MDLIPGNTYFFNDWKHLFKPETSEEKDPFSGTISL